MEASMKDKPINLDDTELNEDWIKQVTKANAVKKKAVKKDKS